MKLKKIRESSEGWSTFPAVWGIMHPLNMGFLLIRLDGV